MPARNTSHDFGWVSRIIHWAMALLILGLLPLGLYIANTQPSLSTLWLFGLHKSLGMAALVLVGVRLIWHRITPPPPIPPDGLNSWQHHLALATRISLYALMLVVPLSGWGASAASGPDVVIFGKITLPRIAPTSETLEASGFLVHRLATRLLMVCLLLHIAGALYHQFILQDRLLARMIRGTGDSPDHSR